MSIFIGTAPGGTGSGLTKLTPTSGTVDGVNKVFVFASAPVHIVSDGVTYYDGSGYTLAALTATMDYAPTGFLYGEK